jgi:hypothetical protein
MRDFFTWVENTAVAVFVSQSTFGFAMLDMLHIAAIAMLFGMILFLDLRLIGITSRARAVTDLSGDVLPWIWGAFAIAVITGVLMFTGQAVKYSANYAFRMKLILLGLAGINMLLFHFIAYRGVAKWNHNAAVPLAGKLAGAISLACWIAIVIYGRFTAYYMY